MIRPATGQRWAIVLAAGEGSRLRELTIDESGVSTPKQFCSLRGDSSLLEAALARARRIAPPDRILAVVAAEHEAWWRPQLASLPERNVVVQPINRGTAAGVLLPLSTVLERDREARVALLPSDHFVERESVLARCLERALDFADNAAEPVLLGITPDGPEREYGWIVRAPSRDDGPARVVTFIEKPGAADAQVLFERGALWSSFLIVARAAVLAQRIETHLPQLARAMLGCERAAAPELAQIYERAPRADLSRDVLQHDAARLRVLAVPHCGWTDLGTPGRVAACLASLPPRATVRERRRDLLDLSRALARRGAVAALAR